MREKNNTNLEQMRELIERLTEADIAYYKNDAPIMTDLEYDRLTEELAGFHSLVKSLWAASNRTRQLCFTHSFVSESHFDLLRYGHLHPSAAII